MGHFGREFPNPTRPSCKYYRQLDHKVEDCLLLIAKMQEKQPTPTHNVQRVKTEIRKVDPYVKVMTCNGLVTQGAKEELASWEGVPFKEQTPLAAPTQLLTQPQIEEGVEPFLKACMKLL